MSFQEQVEQNKAAVRRAIERLNAGDLDGFAAALAPDYVRHCQAMPPDLQEIHGPAVMKQWLASNFAIFPDYHEEIEFLVGEGDYVAWRSRGTGTQKGPMGPFPASNKRMEIVIIGMHRFAGGLIAETWTSWDNLAAMAQLGLMPAAV